MTMATKTPQGARLNPQNTLELSQGMSIQTAINTADAHGGFWVILLYPSTTYNEGDLTTTGGALITIRGMDEHVMIAPAAAPATAVINITETLYLENITVISPDAAIPAVLVNTATGAPTITDCNIIGEGVGYSLQMTRGSVDVHRGSFSGDVHLSTVRCLMDCYFTTFLGDLITAAEPLNHDIDLMSCEFTGGNITSLATGATVLAIEGGSDIGTITDSGTGLFTITGSYVDSVSCLNAGGEIRIRGGTVNTWVGTNGTILWYITSGEMKVLGRGALDDINIMAAHDALPATGGLIHLLGSFSAEDMTITKPGVVLQGQKDSTVIAPTAALGATLFFFANTAIGSGLRDLIIDGDVNTNILTWLVHSLADQFFCSYVTLRNGPSYPLFVQCADDVLIEHSFIHDNGLGPTIAADGFDVSRLRFIFNDSYNNGQVDPPAGNADRMGVQMESAGGGIFYAPLVQGNNLYTNDGCGIWISASIDARIVDNRIYNNDQQGIFVLGGNVDGVIDNNLVRENGADGAAGYGTGIQFGDAAGGWNTSGWNITNNIVRDNGSDAAQRRGIRIWCSDGSINNIRITGNQVSGHKQWQFDFDILDDTNGGTGIDIRDNYPVMPHEVRDAIANILGELGPADGMWVCMREDGGFATVADLTRHGRDLTASKNLWDFDTEPMFKSKGVFLTFNGSDEYMSRADAGHLFSFANAAGNDDSPFSIILILSPAAGALAGATLLAKYEENTPSREWIVRIDANGYPEVELYDESANEYIGREDQTALTADTWTILIVTYDGSETSAGVKIYKDGVQVDDADHQSGGVYTAMEQLGPDLTGIYNVIGGPANGNFYTGAGAWFGLTRKELSADEAWCVTQRLQGLLGI